MGGKKYLLLLAGCALLFVLGMDIDSLSFKKFNHEISRSYHIENLDLLHGGKRIVYENKNIRPVTFSLSFEGMASDDNYDNFFQLADSNSIQLELQHPGKLFLKIGDENLIKVADDIQMNRWYRYDLRGESGRYIRFYIDGKLVFESVADEVVNQKLDYSRIIFGSGYADQRGLQGGIRDLSFVLNGTEESNIIYPVLFLAGIVIGVLLIWLISYLYQSPELELPYRQIRPVYGQIPMLVVYLLAVIIGLVLMKKEFPFAKWSVLFSTGILVALSPFIPQPRNARSTRLDGILTVIVMIMFFGILAFLAINQRIIPSNKFLSYALAVMLPFVYGLARSIIQAKHGKSQIGATPAALEFLVFILIAVCIFFSFADLQNWSLFVVGAREAPARTGMLVITGAFLTAFVTERISNVNHGTEKGVLVPVILVSIVASILFVILSLRTDMLFTGSSMMHWEYYVGVIRSIRNGGWLLYDTPSQYGFLPMLFAAAFPVSSAWDAFYWMQSATLLVAAILFYRGTIRFARIPAPFAVLLTMFLVFFAYPGLIGPAPYPSSGPMRFIWCYVLLYCAASTFTSDQPTVIRYVKVALPFWILGALWSGESAVYSSSIYFAPVGGELFKLLRDQKADWSKTYRRVFALLGVPVAVLVSVMLAISAIYLSFLGAWPDWIMHFAYGFAYAKGFGEVDVPMNGPIWSLLLLMMVGFMSVYMSIRCKGNGDGRDMLALAATACIWSVSSYYLGRAVPNNIVAIFPILVFASLLIMKSWPGDQSRTIPAAVCGALLFLSYISPLSNSNLGKHIAKMNFTQATVSPNLSKAGDELSMLMKTAGISDTSRVVYYGNDAVLPGISDGSKFRIYERTWLPNPLQLMEDPVPEKRQKELVDRWARRRSYAGYLIHRRGEAEDRFAVWLRVLSGAYDLQSTWESANYRILLFARK